MKNTKRLNYSYTVCELWAHGARYTVDRMPDGTFSLYQNGRLLSNHATKQQACDAVQISEGETK